MHHGNKHQDGSHCPKPAVSGQLNSNTNTIRLLFVLFGDPHISEGVRAGQVHGAGLDTAIHAWGTMEGTMERSAMDVQAQQRVYFLRQLKKFNLPRTMTSFLSSSISIWYAAATAKDKGSPQRVIRSAEKVIGCNLPSLQDLYTSRTLRRAGKIVADPSHPGHKLFEILPSGRRLRSIRTKT
ncbi:hypothetical protein N1851_029181 [Merluccius polli]|uniref:Alkylated DNA repair protein AlkB homologue 8 N-terminal domain-containing protein n=1 Tax=Merluccius polli TaxID=89951 RepID=A0AA47M7D3_MERPO|nr:hypothetical protein N1851_029181 [Merluccius polli]